MVRERLHPVGGGGGGEALLEGARPHRLEVAREELLHLGEISARSRRGLGEI